MINANIQHILRCPACKVGLLDFQSKPNIINCMSCNRKFGWKSELPNLIYDPFDLYDSDEWEAAAGANREVKRGIMRWLPKNSVNLSRSKVLKRALTDFLTAREESARSLLVLGGGGQKQDVSRILGSVDKLNLVVIDIDPRADVTVFADGHSLPFMSNCFDAVMTTAVLEHVLSPSLVALEITRVCKQGGLVYSELPFLQAVHEGAFDFTRYTLGGHRLLFEQLSEVESGVVAGPATTLSWALERFLLLFMPTKTLMNVMKLIYRTCFFWLPQLDRALQFLPGAIDSASCTYILGENTNAQASSNFLKRRIIETYRK